MLNLQGKKVVVFGGSSGVGLISTGFVTGTVVDVEGGALLV